MAELNATYPVRIDASTQTVDPADNAVIADTDALNGAYGTTLYSGGGGIYHVLVVVGASAAAKVQVQRRNAANSATVGDIPIIYCPAGSTVAVPFKFEILNGERIRVLMEDALTGNIAVTIQAQKIG